MIDAKGSHVKPKEQRESITDSDFKSLLREYDKTDGSEQAYNKIAKKAEKMGMPRKEFKYAAWYLDKMESGKEISLDPRVMESIPSWRKQQLRNSVNMYRNSKK